MRHFFITILVLRNLRLQFDHGPNRIPPRGNKGSCQMLNLQHCFLNIREHRPERTFQMKMLSLTPFFKYYNLYSCTISKFQFLTTY